MVADGLQNLCSPSENIVPILWEKHLGDSILLDSQTTDVDPFKLPAVVQSNCTW
jgi:hypothetical protein